MISAIFIVNQKGDVIISRNYRVDELKFVNNNIDILIKIN